ncbi:HAT [Theobroma cacao]|nr:HAT [Theobroma cacao]
MASESNNLAPAPTPSDAATQPTPIGMPSSPPTPTTQQTIISTNDSDAVNSKKWKALPSGSEIWKHFTRFVNIKVNKKLDEEDKSELEKYLSLNEPDATDSDDFDVLIWWKLNSHRYPTLALLARDVLAIPPSIIASESAFSTGGRVLDAYRSSLMPKMVQALICAQDWLCGPSYYLHDIENDLAELEKVDEELSKIAVDNNMKNIEKIHIQRLKT